MNRKLAHPFAQTEGGHPMPLLSVRNLTVDFATTAGPFRAVEPPHGSRDRAARCSLSSAPATPDAAGFAGMIDPPQATPGRVFHV